MVTRITRAEVDAGELKPPPGEPAGISADFAAIIAAGDAAEGRAPGADVVPQETAEPPPPDFGGEAREAVELVASLALPVVAWKWGQAVADLYGTAQRERIAQALARVAEKRGWTMAGVLDGWGPELALCAALAGPALPLMIAASAPPPPTVADKPAPFADPTEAVPVHAGDDFRVS